MVGWKDYHELGRNQQNWKPPHLVTGTSLFSQEMHIKMDTTDSSSEQGEEEYTKYRYVRHGGQLKEIMRRTGGRIIVKTDSVLHNFGGQFIPAGQYVFPFSYKTGENFPASFCVHVFSFRTKQLIGKAKGVSNTRWEFLWEGSTQEGD